MLWLWRNHCMKSIWPFFILRKNRVMCFPGSVLSWEVPWGFARSRRSFGWALGANISEHLISFLSISLGLAGVKQHQRIYYLYCWSFRPKFYLTMLLSSYLVYLCYYYFSLLSSGSDAIAARGSISVQGPGWPGYSLKLYWVLGELLNTFSSPLQIGCTPCSQT